MHSWGQYILSVGLAALLAGIIGEFADQKSASGTLTRMVCGLFLAFTVINPITELNFGILETFSAQNSLDTVSAVSTGEELAVDYLRQIIKQETEAYILDKARSYNCDPEVVVTIGDGDNPVPEAAQISGDISPQTRRQLQTLLEQELGISKENQQWIG